MSKCGYVFKRKKCSKVSECNSRIPKIDRGVKLDPGISVSEPDLVTANKKKWDSGFPPGFSVDELWRFRKRRPPAETEPHDNLHPAEGSLRDVHSEYADQFGSYLLSSSCGDLPTAKVAEEIPVESSDSLKPTGREELQAESDESLIDYPLDNSERQRRNADIRTMESIHLGDAQEGKRTETSSELRSAYTNSTKIHRRHPLRRPTNLKLEGELLTVTEKAAKFIDFLLAGRPELARKPTALKLEGEMDIKTENQEKYVPFEYQQRPLLCKKNTNLHLEGDLMGMLSENHDKFVAYKVQERPHLRKRDTNLHLEGDLNFDPEYRKAFVEYKVDKCLPYKPMNNLKTEGLFDMHSEMTTKFMEHQIHPTIPFLRGDYRASQITLGDDSSVSRAEYRDKFVTYPRTERPAHLRPTEHIKQEGFMQGETENKDQFVEKSSFRTRTTKMPNNLLLEGRIDMNPEYRNAYVDFGRDSRCSPVRRSRRVSQESHLKSEGEIEINPEYRSAYIDYPRQRPRVHRPVGSLSSEGEMDHLTEKSAQYVPFTSYQKAESLKREPELKLEGRFECQPEYRKAFIDYLTREKIEMKSRPLDHLSGKSREDSDSKENKNETENKQNGNLETTINNTFKPVQPAPSYTSQTESSLRKSRSPPRKSLSRIESSVFGPKLVVSSAHRPSITSRSPSPRTCVSVPRAKSRVSSRFASPVRVENLACKEAKSAPNVSARRRWQRETEKPAEKAFVVLDNTCDKFDVNRNYKELYKEQKWMPSWYNSSM